jgi:hypothetical protein
MRHPSVPVLPEVTTARRWLALCGLVMLALTFSYMPISAAGKAQSVLEILHPPIQYLRLWHFTR